METKIDENSHFSAKGWNARNYLFYNRKRGSRHLKVMKKRYRIDAKSMQEKGMQKVWKMMPKCIQKGSKIYEKSKKGGKKGMPKNMPKFDAENDLKKHTLAAIWIPGGWPREVRRASLRRRRLRHTGLIWNAWHQPVSADCSCRATADTFGSWR